LKKIQKLLVKNDLISASDGSAHTDVKAAFAFCFADMEGKVLYKSHAPVLIDPEYASSDRAELLGILGILYKLYEFEKKIRTLKSHHFYLYTDSESSIKLLKKTFFPSTKTVMKSNMDVLLEIQDVKKKLKTSIELIHVKAHQDDTVSFADLSVPAQLNVRMDKLAEKQYKNPISEHYRKMPHLPAQQVSFSNMWYRMTNNLEKELVRWRRDSKAEESSLTSWKINKPNAKYADWLALEGAMKKWSRYSKGTPVKCIHALWDTTSRKKEWGQIHSAICLLCGTEDETVEHVLRCEHPVMVTARKNTLNGLRNQLFPGTEIHLARWFWVATVQWLNFFEPSLPPKVSPYKGIRKAIMNQYNFGMGNLFRGILSIRWRQIQEKYLKKNLMKM